jgi:hypothetical protein
VGHVKRRSVLKLFTAGAVSAAAWPLLRASRVEGAPSTTASRFYIHIIPQGGMDPVYTTDAKRVADVDAGTDVPYGPDQITEAGGARLGPGFRALGRWMPKLAIVNAIRQNSANHHSGLSNVTRFKSSTTRTTPSLLEILGARRSHGEATGAINLGAVVPTAFSPLYLGEPGELTFGLRPGMFDHLDKAEPDDLIAVSKALRAQAAALDHRRATAAERMTAENFLSSAELFSRVATRKFVPAWSFGPGSDVLQGHKEGAARDVERAVWLIENNLTRCVTVCFSRGQGFDTHVDNAMQLRMTRSLAAILDQMFSDLDRKIVDGKPLSEQTTVIIGSEMGRFPKLNAGEGKDHFPQAPHLFYGPGIATNATYSATGRDFISVKTSLKTGKPDASGHQLRVDDVGTTLLTLDGANPELFGYQGELLHFLVRK